MEKKNYLRKGIFALLVAAATLAGCSKDSDSNDTPTPPVVQDPYKEWPIKPKIKEGETSYISLHTEREVGKVLIFNLKGNGWIDLNNNGVQDADEKTEVFDGKNKNYTLQSQVFTLYGIINTLEMSTCALKDIDVSHAPSLQELSVNENALSELNVKENKFLTTLDVDNNQFEELNLSENKYLTSLQLQNNSIRELNLSKNTVLTELYVSNNRLSALDLRENKSLTTLDVDNNQLSALELSTDTQLNEVHLIGNKLGEEAMLKIVEKLPQRKEGKEGYITLQTFQIVDGKQEAENNKLNQEILDKLGAKKWKAQFISKKGYLIDYNGNLNTPHETP